MEEEEMKAKEGDHEYVVKKMEYEIEMIEATSVKSEHVKDEDDEDGDVLAAGHTKKNFQLKDLKCLVLMTEWMKWMHFYRATLC